MVGSPRIREAVDIDIRLDARPAAIADGGLSGLAIVGERDLASGSRKTKRYAPLANGLSARCSSTPSAPRSGDGLFALELG